MTEKDQSDVSKLPALMDLFGRLGGQWLQLASLQWQTAARYWEGIAGYSGMFFEPGVMAAAIFAARQKTVPSEASTVEILQDYLALMAVNADLAIRGGKSSLDAAMTFHGRRWPEWMDAWMDCLTNPDTEGADRLLQLGERQFELIKTVVKYYPKAIRDIEKEYGFHFDDGGYVLAAETDRFQLYQVLPKRKGVSVRKDAKPIVVIPPSVLGPNILAFLPGENRSFVHAFANQGFPTYIRIVKPIADHPAVQVMTGEHDVEDTRLFCETVFKKHGRPATLCGYCQGGFMAMLALLSGELDNFVDALMTCVSPMDGSRSRELVDFIHLLPPRFRDLGYALKTLPNGNRVVDGALMSWVYKLKSIETDGPIVTFYRDLEMFDRATSPRNGISKTAAAINHWLLYDRVDIPEAITRLSFESYTQPVATDGTLPVRLFDRKLNFKRLKEKGIPYLICYAEKDNLVDPAAALAPADFIDVELSSYPKGHVAIATSCLDPSAGDGEYACTNKGCNGPVEFQIGLDVKKTRSRK